MKALRASRILTMNPDLPEIHDGGVLIENDHILAVGTWAAVRTHGRPVDLGTVTLVPGLVNAHTHLELSHLAGRIPAGLGFMDWADALFRLLRKSGFPDTVLPAVLQTLKDLGVAVVVDIANRHGHLNASHLENHGLYGLMLQEYAGNSRKDIFDPDIPVAWGCAVHALYSTDGGYARRIKEWCRESQRLFSMHLAEVPGENELFRTGRGVFADFLRQRKILPKTFAVPECSAVGYAHELGLLDSSTLAVHCVHISEEDAELFKHSGATVCLCPRSNAWIGVGRAPVEMLLAHGVPLCLGTDSLASNSDLDLLNELRYLGAAMDRRIPLETLLAMVTTTPATVLGIEDHYGSIAVGKKAALAVLPEDFQNFPVK